MASKESSGGCVDSIGSFISLLRQSNGCLQDAADMLARLFSADSSIILRICDAHRDLPRALLDTLLKVGQKKIRVELLQNSCRAYRSLFCLPYAAQSALLDSASLDLVVSVSPLVVRKVKLAELRGQQISQLITKHGARVVNEQVLWLKAKASSAQNSPTTVRWSVKNNSLIVGTGKDRVQFTRDELFDILKQMS